MSVAVFSSTPPLRRTFFVNSSTQLTHRSSRHRRSHLSLITRATIAFQPRLQPSRSKAKGDDRKNRGWTDYQGRGRTRARGLFDYDATHRRPNGAWHPDEKIYRQTDRAIRARQLRGSQSR